MEEEPTLRKRKNIKAKGNSAEKEISKNLVSKPKTHDLGATYWLTRIVFLRSLSAIYFVAFLIAYNQNKQLIGDNGLLPLRNYLTKLNEHFNGDEQNFSAKFQKIPTLFWLLEPWSNIDIALDYFSLTGLAISCAVFVTGAANSVALTVLWILYLSIVNVGQQWYSFGWESQLLETGFLAIWIVPMFSWKSLPPNNPSPWIAIVFYRWLIMRIMLGAGLIKIRGDHCWIDLTCMNYFYETQPNPNPIAYYAHQAPEWWHKFETFGNHVVELILPLFTLIPLRLAGMINGSFQILFQLILISTGNLSFLNWLTILPSIWFFDDNFFSAFFSNVTVEKVQEVEDVTKTSHISLSSRLRRGVHIIIALLLSYLSYPIVLNLISSGQIMNTSYEPFRIVNTYGAFGSVTKNRTEVVLEGTWDADPKNPNTNWMEYDFPCKPVDLTQRPCLISPYHYRLDWLMWFAAFQRWEMNPWMVHLAGKMLQNDQQLLDALGISNPFRAGPPPRYIRASHYAYSYAKLGTAEADTNGQWWTRTYIGQYLHPLSLRTLDPLYTYYGWQDELNQY